MLSQVFNRSPVRQSCWETRQGGRYFPRSRGSKAALTRTHARERHYTHVLAGRRAEPYPSVLASAPLECEPRRERLPIDRVLFGGDGEARLNRPLLPYVARFWTGRQGMFGAMAVRKTRFLFSNLRGCVSNFCVASRTNQQLRLSKYGSGSPAETTLLS